MPGTLQDGLVVAQRIRAAFEIAGRTVSGRYVGATVSIGVAAHESAANIDALLARADAALYAAKANGRNRVEAEVATFDLLQTSEPDAEFDELALPGRPDRAGEARPHADAVDRRAA
jgi:hypothetical protein